MSIYTEPRSASDLKECYFYHTMGCSHWSMLDFVVARSEKRIRSDESCHDG
jgi:hypothetical protein